MAVQDPVRWTGEFTRGIVRAHGEGKPVLVYFRAEWCSACARLEEGPLKAPEFVRAAQDVVPVRIDVDVDRGTRERLGVDTFPGFALVDPRTGKRISLFEGRRTAKRLAEWLAREAPPHRVWFDSLERAARAAKKRKRALAVVEVDESDESDAFLLKLRSRAMLASWDHVVFAMVRNGKRPPRLRLLDAAGKELGRIDSATKEPVREVFRILNLPVPDEGQ